MSLLKTSSNLLMISVKNRICDNTPIAALISSQVRIRKIFIRITINRPIGANQALFL